MVSLNKSFLYGICFASLTWVVSIYLYFQLTRQESTTKNTIQPWNQRSSAFKKNLFDEPLNKYEKKDRSYYEKSEKKINSQKLRPVMPKKNELLDEELIELGMVKTPEDKKVKDEGYKIYAYNILISNRLSLNRSIPDTRNDLCKIKKYDNDLPTASIIVCFFNEHFQTLLRTVQSILNRTPVHLLEEILLVNDHSDIAGLHKNVDDYIQTNKLSKVKLLRPENREGLIRARLFGARKAQGKILIFLDSHIEVNVGWIEPLLHRIKENRSHVVMPIIDIINPDTFGYSSSPLVRGGFNWGLHFKWESLPKGTLESKEDFVKPVKSPTMAGGLFAIDKQYFIDIGEYDAGMNIWGGENLEISFRIWMCGGTLEIIPCSKVGHIFRHRRPYGSPDGEDTMLHNSLRVAYVWMDDYKQYFLEQRPDAKKVNYGDISSRLQLRRELKCKDFDWYLKNVYPEFTIPSDDAARLKRKWSAVEQDKFQPWHSRKRNYVDQYSMRLANSKLCVKSAKDHKTKNSGLILRPCSNKKGQRWYETDKSELVLEQLFCLQAGKAGPILFKCHEMGGNQEWKHKGGLNTAIYNLAAGTCLGVNDVSINAPVIMKLCTDPNMTNWDLIS